jgi:hypothetical protein
MIGNTHRYLFTEVPFSKPPVSTCLEQEPDVNRGLPWIVNREPIYSAVLLQCAVDCTSLAWSTWSSMWNVVEESDYVDT